MNSKKALLWFSLAFIALSIYRATALFSHEIENYQWDSKVYYNAPVAWSQGTDVYSQLNFVYPPFWLPVFKVFSLLNFNTFYFVFLLFKAMALAAITLILWKSVFPKVHLGVIALLVWLGFYGSLFLDLRAGNIGIIETLLITLALREFVKKKWRRFGILIVIAASFKMTPILLLGLLLFVNEKKKALSAFKFSVGLFLGYLLLNALVFPAESKAFVLASLSRVKEGGIVAPSIFSLLNELTETGKLTFIAAPLYLFIVAAIAYITWKAIRKTQDPLFIYSLGVTAYGLILPRMKDYGYGLLIPAAIFSLGLIDKRHGRYILVFLLIMTSTVQVLPPLVNFLTILFWNYLPMFQALLLWAILVESAKPNTTKVTART